MQKMDLRKVIDKMFILEESGFQTTLLGMNLYTK